MSPQSIPIITSFEIVPFKLEQSVQFIERAGTNVGLSKGAESF